MKIQTLEVAGFEASFEAMRLPHRSGEKSDSYWEDSCFIRENQHPVCFNGRPYGCDGEVEYFVVGPNDLKLAQKLILAGPEHAKCIRGITVWVKVTGPWYWFNELDTYCVGRTPLSSTSSMYIDCKGLTGEELQKAKGKIRGDYEYTRIFSANYQCLRNIYFQRRSHRLPEWHQFCEWIESLPLSKELITLEKQ